MYLRSSAAHMVDDEVDDDVDAGIIAPPVVGQR
jgi:hypothetical protein